MILRKRKYRDKDEGGYMSEKYRQKSRKHMYLYKYCTVEKVAFLVNLLYIAKIAKLICC